MPKVTKKTTKKVKKEEVVEEAIVAPIPESTQDISVPSGACPSCNGSGKQNSDDLCLICQGSGRGLL